MADNTESQELLFQLNEFYRDNYRRTMKCLSFLVFVCFGLTLVLAWMSFDQRQPAYYAAMTTGEVIPMHALSEPVVTDAFVERWSELAARVIYNLSFAKYQDQLNTVKNHFSDTGWAKMMAALESSGMLSQLVNSRLIISSVITGPPVILARMIISGRYTWSLQMKILVTYTSASATRKRDIIVSMVVQRVPTLDAAQGIQIVGFGAHNALM